MKKRITRSGLLILLAVVALAAASVRVGRGWLGATKATAQIHDGSVKFITDSVDIWALSNSQLLRVSINSQTSAISEEISFTFAKIEIENQTGDLILQRELQVPQGQFRIIEFSYDQLIAAGIDAEPTGQIQFLIRTRTGTSQAKTQTVGATQETTIGAAQSVNVSSGRTEMYQPLISSD